MNPCTRCNGEGRVTLTVEGQDMSGEKSVIILSHDAECVECSGTGEEYYHG